VRQYDNMQTREQPNTCLEWTKWFKTLIIIYCNFYYI